MLKYGHHKTKHMISMRHYDLYKMKTYMILESDTLYDWMNIDILDI